MRSCCVAVGEIDNTKIVVVLSNMKATLLLKQRHAVDREAFADLVWKVPAPSTRTLAFFQVQSRFRRWRMCVLRYDNEQGKGDHRHLGKSEAPYEFSTPEQLIADFWADIDSWRSK